MISRLHLSALLGISALVGGVILLVNGVSVRLSWLSSIGATVTITSLVLLAFEHWAWRWRWLSGWFVQRPDLRGTWRVTMDSSWTGGGETSTQINAYLVVRQTYTKLSLRMLTPESASEMVGCSIERAEDGLFLVTGTYRNEPRIGVRDRSPIHFGAVALRVEGDPPASMSGHYWTDRLTRGEMLVSARVTKAAHSFDEARSQASTGIDVVSPATMTS